MQKSLTVFTPTFNRATLLPRLYESLKNQTSKNFVWMIIDDGSIDETPKIVEFWIREGALEIEYFYKKNEGMHSAHNYAYENIKTEYNVCIDSDDTMPNNAVEIILDEIKKIDSNEVSGIVGLDEDMEGKIIGDRFPENLNKIKLQDFYLKYKLSGDRKLVYKTRLIQSVPPYPIFEGEKLVPLDYKYMLLDREYDLVPVNKVLCTVEYQEDGSTKNMLKQYRRHPRGFAFSRIVRINGTNSFKEKIKNAIHLVSCSLFLQDYSILFGTKNTVLVLLVFPLGFLLNLYIRLKTKKNP